MSARRQPPAERLFRLLLALFPRDFRERFGQDMAELFRDELRAAHRRGGPLAVAALWLRTVPGVAGAALLERRDALRHALRERPRAVPRHPTPARSDGMLATLGADLRFAARMLRKSPLFTVVAVLCISLGSGAVTTIFSTLNALVLRPLPGAADGERLLRLERKQPGAPDGVSASYPLYALLRDRTRTLDGLAAWGKASLTLRRGGEMGTAVYGSYVSGNFFAVLGVRPLLGRFFAPEEGRTEGTHPVIVVSEGFWRLQLGADSAAVGRELLVNGHPFTLVGVAPREFQGLDAPIQGDAWVPIHMSRRLHPTRGALDSPHVTWLRLAGRLAPGASAAAAHAELSALTAAFAATADEPEVYRAYREMRASPLTGLPPDASRPLGTFLGVLLGAAALVLLIASVNVAAMLSARAIARQREMAVRAALGAARARLVRQLLTETLVLFVLGAAGGVLLAVAATGALERLPLPTEVPFVLELSPDPRVLAFALLVSLATGVVFGTAPARRAVRADLALRLRDGTAGSGTRRTLMGSALVVGQLALSLVLLVGAGLFARALQHGSRMDPGVDAAGVATAMLDAESWGYDEARGRAFFDALRDRVAALPGVTAVSYATTLPLGLRSSVDRMRVHGSAATGADGLADVHYNEVGAGYFDALRLPLVDGRPIAATDDARAPRVAVVNETLARRFWPEGGAIGRTLEHRGERVTVVGVARDARYASLTEATPPLAYFPLAQWWAPRRALLVRTDGDPGAIGDAVGAAMRAIDAEVPRPTVMPLERAMGLGLMPQRVGALVAGALGGVGLLLATVGLYGIIAYSASRRTREIGIRLALGARSADVLRMVAREGLRLTATGVALGLLLAAAATRLLAGFLFGVSPLDGVTYVAMSALFVGVALLACWLPARRAAAADPALVLRGD